MVVISFRKLRDFYENHPSSKVALFHWLFVCKSADWKNLADIRKDFNNVDYVGNDRYVFNIKGNDYRIIAMIHFSIRTIYVKFIGTHAEYDKINASSI